MNYKKLYWENMEKFHFNEKLLCKDAKISMRSLRQLKKSNPRVHIRVALRLAISLDCSIDDLIIAFY